jgi:subtilisin family serine protease
MRVTSGLVAALTALSPLACTESTPESSGVEAVSNRPQQYDRFIAIVKLKTPPLLAAATGAEALEAEQQELIGKLAALSPDIRVLYRYKLVLNGIAIVAPKALEPQFREMAEVSYVEGETPFTRPEVEARGEQLPPANLGETNSAAWIGASRVRRELSAADAPIDGRGTRVGVVDTGIDYTHAMFGGTGTPEAYSAIDPSQDATDAYPSAKVAGGVDLVGTAYDTSSPKFDHHIPLPDANPIDEAGHGTHVAATIAGKGDSVRSYDGVAPEAQLYAIKVFGKNGSTGDAVIIAALEYAADPNGDLDPKDRLDVINLSLGGDYGTPHVLYSEAVGNLARAGTVAVMAAGNSGPNPFIVGAPSTANEAVSVAATIDNMEHNWKFPTVKLSTPENPSIVVEAVEASFTKPIADLDSLSGKLVHIGLADRELTAEEAAALQGNVALIDRGVVTFEEKVSRAARAGAIGAVVANNQDGTPTAMGGETKVEIPGIMVSRAIGETLKTALAAGGDVRIDFKNADRVERPELIDTITDFSSEGPRAIDGYIKPEVAAPGYQIWSAKVGGGSATVAFNGTSMATPHVAGVAALLRQRFATAPVSDIKSLIVNTAKPIVDSSHKPYTIARAGAGRVQAFEAATSDLVFPEATLSLGEVLVESQKTLRKTLTVKSLGGAKRLSIEWSSVDGLELSGPSTVDVAAGASQTLTFDALIKAPQGDAANQLLGTNLVFKDETGREVGRVPVLAVAKRVSRIKAKSLEVKATSVADAPGSVASFKLANDGRTSGDALAFNLLAKDERVGNQGRSSQRIAVCDLQSAGYRTVRRTKDDGQTVELLQIAVKLYTPISNWQLCEVSVQIDGDGDGVADQELLGTHAQTLTENAADAQTFSSILTDAAKLRTLRAAWETSFGQADAPASAGYADAIVDTQSYDFFGHSTVAVVSADVSKLAKNASGELRVKLAVLPYESGTPAGDDYLAGQESRWTSLPLARENMPFVDIPERIALAAGAEETVSLTAGGTRGSLVIYLPHNASNVSLTRTDEQQQVLSPRFTNGR